MLRFPCWSVLAVCLAAQAVPVCAEPTHVMIRAMSEDAKFMGDHTGGVEVTLRDATTHKLLGQGVIHGGTGDTDRIMKAPRTRGVALADAQTAGFDAVIDIVRPTLVDIDARGPLGLPASAIIVHAQTWVTPGQAMIGDGVVLQFSGLLITPEIARSADGTIKLGAKVTMMCGCPISPGGLWDEANYRISADVLDGGTVVNHIALHYAGIPSEFTADLPRSKDRQLTVRIVAIQSTAQNTGVVEVPLP